MNKKIMQLAFGNVKKYRKHYIFVAILTFTISIFFISFSSIGDNYYQAKKQYNIQKYGEWYSKQTLLKDTDRELLIEEAKYMPETYMLSFQYNQGLMLNEYRIGHVEDEMYDFCKLTLVEGQYPKNLNEVMIAEQVEEELGVSIGDLIVLSLFNEVKEYTIVGVIHNSQDNIFPDIYTSMAKGNEVEVFTNELIIQTNDVLIPYSSEATFVPESIYINPYGYRATFYGETTENSVSEVLILVEILFVGVFALSAMNSTSSKRRLREFALLRGMGMQNSQLFLMIFYEMFFIVLISILIGIILSFPLHYGIKGILQNVYQFNDYVISIRKTLLYTLIFIVSVMVLMIYPIYSSSKNALSGTFDGVKFQKIQIRYKKLKYQNKFRLALREMSAHKKITISLYLVLSMMTLLVTLSLFDKDVINAYQIKEKYALKYYDIYGGKISGIERDVYWNERYPGKVIKLKRISLTERMIINNVEATYKLNVYCIDNFDDYYVIEKEGLFPIRKDEMFLGSMTISYEKLVTNSDGIRVFMATGGSIGSMMIKDKIYRRTGYYLPYDGLDDSYPMMYILPKDAVYVLPSVYNQIVDDVNNSHEDIYYRVFVENEEEEKQLRLDILSLTGAYSPQVDDDIVYDEPYKNIITIESDMLYALLAIGYIFLYYFNKNAIYNHMSDIRLYKIIGARNVDIMMKQICKAFILTVLTTVTCMFWIFLMNRYYEITYIPYTEYFICIICVFILCIFVFCLPLMNILKNDLLTLIKGDE